MDASNEIFETRFDHVNHARACKDMRVRRPRADRLGSNVLFAGVGLGLAIAVLSDLTGLADKPWANLVAIVIILAVVFFYIRWLRKRSQRILALSPFRAGISRVALEDAGLRISTDATDTYIRWAFVKDAIVTPQALLVRYTDHEYYPIEAAAFADEAAMRATADDIAARVAAAKR